MMHRLLLIAIFLVTMVVVPGCKKETPSDKTQQVQKENSAQEVQAEQADEKEQEMQEDMAAEE